jgi:hypothetical protein
MVETSVKPSPRAPSGSLPAFVVLAHKSPRQAARLAARLAPMRVYLHLDARVAPARLVEFRAAAAHLDNVTFLPRRRTGWASWGLVEAALDGVAAALEGRCSHVMTLSGQDYPLLPADEIQRFFAQEPQTSYLASWRLPAALWGRRGGLDRLRLWQTPIAGRRVRLPIPRRLPPGFTPYGGPMYWALAASTAAEVLRVRDARPDLVRFYRHTWIPDEMFVPTVVMNSTHRDAVVGEALTYTRWVEGAAHPHILEVGELDRLALAASGPSDVGGRARRKLFARKFEAENDTEVLDLIDARLLGVGPPSDRTSPFG